ncbi:hypothetical protein DM860_011552 [Cuscuta australis]|uniref:Uncharacterized protein n=1 Tax=Cuscuta australis TaxID=267555 RepID=A0A328D0T3_9ASTE|nr:hypothetical protein DM860_011552 [Cuscuta australis]
MLENFRLFLLYTLLASKEFRGLDAAVDTMNGVLKNGKGKAFRMTRQIAKSIEAVDHVKIQTYDAEHYIDQINGGFRIDSAGIY